MARGYLSSDTHPANFVLTFMSEETKLWSEVAKQPTKKWGNYLEGNR